MRERRKWQAEQQEKLAQRRAASNAQKLKQMEAAKSELEKFDADRQVSAEACQLPWLSLLVSRARFTSGSLGSVKKIARNRLAEAARLAVAVRGSGPHSVSRRLAGCHPVKQEGQRECRDRVRRDTRQRAQGWHRWQGLLGEGHQLPRPASRPQACKHGTPRLPIPLPEPSHLGELGLMAPWAFPCSQ